MAQFYSQVGGLKAKQQEKQRHTDPPIDSPNQLRRFFAILLLATNEVMAHGGSCMEMCHDLPGAPLRGHCGRHSSHNIAVRRLGIYSCWRTAGIPVIALTVRTNHAGANQIRCEPYLETLARQPYAGFKIVGRRVLEPGLSLSRQNLNMFQHLEPRLQSNRTTGSRSQRGFPGVFTPGQPAAST